MQETKDQKIITPGHSFRHLLDSNRKQMRRHLLPVRRPPPERQPSKIERIWGPVLGRQFTPIATALTWHHHKLEINAVEYALLCQLLSHKWDERAPHPALSTVATRMGLSQRYVRRICQRLERKGFIRRELHPTGGCSRYHFDGLFEALEQVISDEAESAEQAGEW